MYFSPPNLSSKEVIVIAIALFSATTQALLSKVIISTKSRGITGEEELFSSPLYQTLVMFLAMSTSLVVHSMVIIFKLPFPGYKIVDQGKMPISMYYAIIFPAVCDACSTVLFMLGLRYVSASIFQMLKGSSIIFVALIKHFILKTKLKVVMWIGMFWIVVSVILVGASAILSQNSNGDNAENGQSQQQPIIGIVLIMFGAMILSLQFTFEEKVMSTGAVQAPLLFMVGMEGFWGTLICLFCLYPAAYLCPGTDHNSFENPYNTFVMLMNSQSIQVFSLLFFLSAFLYNIFGCLVTLLLDSVLNAMLDNFSVITVWVCDLLIFYCISDYFGESWARWSFLQLLGLAALLYGAVLYNAPKPASIQPSDITTPSTSPTNVWEKMTPVHEFRDPEAP